MVQNLFAEVGAVLASGRMIPVNAFAEGDQVVVEFEGQGRTEDGRYHNNRYCSVLRIGKGRITHDREYLDTDLVSSVSGIPERPLPGDVIGVVAVANGPFSDIRGAEPAATKRQSPIER